MSDITTSDLQQLMDSYSSGSDGRTRHWTKSFIFTDGVKAAADLAGSHWLLDLVGTECAPICLKRWKELEDGQCFLGMKVRGNAATITLHDGNDDDVPPYWKREIEYTNFPEGDWSWYLFMDGCLVPGEDVLVMLLPSEN
jgi:hypothetical protein